MHRWSHHCLRYREMGLISHSNNCLSISPSIFNSTQNQLQWWYKFWLHRHDTNNWVLTPSQPQRSYQGVLVTYNDTWMYYIINGYKRTEKQNKHVLLLCVAFRWIHKLLLLISKEELVLPGSIHMSIVLDPSNHEWQWVTECDKTLPPFSQQASRSHLLDTLRGSGLFKVWVV